MNEIEEISSNINIKEGIKPLFIFLKEAYFCSGISTKSMANALSLPIPIVSAIRKEFKKKDFLKEANGISLSDKGIVFVEKNMKFDNINIILYKEVMQSEIEDLLPLFLDEIDEISEIYYNRPTVDVTLDQSNITPETGLKRALKLLKNDCLIGKTLAFLGDDDLVTISICILMKKLFKNQNINDKIKMHLFEIDERIIEFITETAKNFSLEITAYNHDLRKPIAPNVQVSADCIVTDPPYTLTGIQLFLSRGIELCGKGAVFMLSFGQKNPNDCLEMQRIFVDCGLIVKEINRGFNAYVGAQMLGGISDLYILETTDFTVSTVLNEYSDKLYTGDFRNVNRKYKCKNCNTIFDVGTKKQYETIELLKENKCNNCNGEKFTLLANITRQ